MEVFYELGGVNTVTAALNRLYAKVLADQRMRPIFNEMNAEGLKKHVLPFMALVLSGLNESYALGVRKTRRGGGRRPVDRGKNAGKAGLDQGRLGPLSVRVDGGLKP